MNFDHYTIRLATENDAPNFFRIVDENRKRLEDFFAGFVSKTKTAEDTEVLVKDWMKLIAERKYYPFPIINNNTALIIGFIDVKNIDWKVGKAELGCFLDDQYAAKGLSKKALNPVIEHLFSEYNFQKLFLRTHPKNTPARKLAEGCGFEVEGVLRKDYKTTAGELVDLVYYGLLRD